MIRKNRTYHNAFKQRLCGFFCKSWRRPVEIRYFGAMETDEENINERVPCLLTDMGYAAYPIIISIIIDMVVVGLPAQLWSATSI